MVFCNKTINKYIYFFITASVALYFVQKKLRKPYISTIKKIDTNEPLLALVVGGTSGIGRGMAMKLAQENISVVIVGRNEESGKEIIEEMRALNNNQKYEFEKCDVQELSNVNKLSEDFLKKHKKLDFLVLTQGIGTFEKEETKEGINQKLALHFYSRMGFIYKLLPLLKNSKKPKVISVLSGGVHYPYKDYKKDPDLQENYSLKNCANAAGFYNDLILNKFADDNKNVAFVHINPGFVYTNWGHQLPFYVRMMFPFIKPFAKTKEECADYMCESLLDDNLNGGFYIKGQYNENGNKTDLHNIDSMNFIWDHMINDVFKKYLK
jgi:NAD(P)-dependent dehydrogenase (short-subunit alcohol dehydrogenase family)